MQTELPSLLTSQVTLASRMKGLNDFKRGAVQIDECSESEVLATVQGKVDYDVDLDLDGNLMYVRCTCPLAEKKHEICHHIWATILSVQKRGFARNYKKKQLEIILTNNDEESVHGEWGEKESELEDWEDEESELEGWDERPSSYSPYRINPGPSQPQRPKPALPQRPKPAKKESWKEKLAAVRRELGSSGHVNNHPTVAAERQLIYIVDVAASERDKKLVVEVQVVERKKDGNWSKPKGQHYTSSQWQNVANALDRQIISLLTGAERSSGNGYYSGNYYGYSAPCFRIERILLDSCMPLLARTGRVHLRQKDQLPGELLEAVPDLEPPWQLIVGIARSAKHWVLSGRLQRGELTLTLAEPTLLVPGAMFWQGKFSRFDDGGAFAWVLTLRIHGTISVPLGKANELLDHLLQMPRIPSLDLPEELRYTEEVAKPRPRFIVKGPKSHYDRNTLEAKLSFEYGGQVVKALESTRGIFLQEEKRFLLRDTEAELAAQRRIIALGAKNSWASAYDNEQTYHITASKLPKIVREVIAEGWLVEAEGKLYRQPGEFKLDIHSERDWFDLSATVSFEGVSAPLPRLLAALKRNENSVVLDDGSLGLLPEDWLKKYGLFARMGTIEGDQIRFSRTQVGVLDALLAARPDVTFDEQFARARDHLKKFKGVVPHDPPAEFQGQLREYQRDGLGWLHFLRNFGFGGCLADDMGLGKTVQVLALFCGQDRKTSLVVVPRSLVFNWKQEAARFAPELKVLDHTGTTRDRTGASFTKHDLVLTTYGTLRNDADIFSKFHFDTCVLDESQAAKNIETETAKAVRLIDADHRLALSGTPVENHLGELWTLFDFLNPGMLGRGIFVGAAGGLRNPDNETREILARALQPFILRRTKGQVAKDLPAKTEQTVYCDLEGEQRQLYDELREHYRQALLAKVDTVGMGRSKIQILEALLRLRQAACHPGLIDKKRVKSPSAKLDILLAQLEELAESGSKVLVFSQFTSFLSIVRTRLDHGKIPYEYLDGKTRDRAARVERFQTDPECKLFLVSLKAGGVGLNLTAAEYVFLLDPWWNPAVEAQAIDRAHRIGQTKPVFAYRLIARGTVEEKVLALQQSKRELADAILGGDGRLITDLKREDLEMLLS